MLAFPNCKINLGLYIIDKRGDGYHNLETVFYPAPLHDILEIIPSRESQTKLTFSGSGIPVDCSPEKNLCVKAYQLIDADYDLPPVSIFLHKVIPMGAGLGGGSSDGACTIRLLNQLFDLSMTEERMAAYASQLGSDCAFFIFERAMFGEGRGEILSPADVNLEGFHLVLIKPDIAISTAEAYKEVHLGRPEIPIQDIIKLPVTDWRKYLKNNFEINIFRNHPEIESLKSSLYDHGALFAAMSGSGSTVFGIFKELPRLAGKFPGTFYWEGKL